MDKHQQAGFTIVELLIAMVISLTLIFACASVYSSLQKSISISQNLSKAQESLRTAHYLMSRSVRQGAGLQISGSGTTQSLIVIYGEEADSHQFFGCLGEPQASGAKDTFYIKNLKNLYCKTEGGVSPDDELIALNVTSLAATFAGGVRKGVDITLKIDGMPTSMETDGFTFSLAMRQRILIDAGISGGSATSDGLSTNL